MAYTEVILYGVKDGKVERILHGSDVSQSDLLAKAAAVAGEYSHMFLHFPRGTCAIYELEVTTFVREGAVL